jgi:hypothetical protein
MRCCVSITKNPDVVLFAFPISRLLGEGSLGEVIQDSYGGHGYQARFWDLMQYSRAAISCSAPGKLFEEKTIFLQRGTMFCREGMLLFVGRDVTFFL